MKLQLGNWKAKPRHSSGVIAAEDNGIFFLSAQSHGFKGLFGLHSWISVRMANETEARTWTVIELTDLETLDVQRANVIYCPTRRYDQKVPTISSARIPDGMWFGSPAFVWGKIETEHEAAVLRQLLSATREYPLTPQFNTLSTNCNTFISYLLYRTKEWHSISPPRIFVGGRGFGYWTRRGQLNDSASVTTPRTSSAMSALNR